MKKTIMICGTVMMIAMLGACGKTDEGNLVVQGNDGNITQVSVSSKEASQEPVQESSKESSKESTQEPVQESSQKSSQEVKGVNIDVVGKFTANDHDEINFGEDGIYAHYYSIDGSDTYIVTGKYEKDQDGKYIMYDIDLFGTDEKIVYAEGIGISEDELQVHFVEMNRDMTYARKK